MSTNNDSKWTAITVIVFFVSFFVAVTAIAIADSMSKCCYC